MIVLCAGGTGGHVFPAEGLAAHLKKRGHKLALFTDSRAMNFVNYEYFDAIEILNVKRSNIITYVFTMLRGILKSLIFFHKNRVNLVVGFGGYPSLPGMIAAQLTFKKTLLHEQNAVLGRANRLLLKFAKGLAISFSQTNGAPYNAVWKGNPVRELVHVAMSKPQSKDPNRFHVCVIGGSQGAKLFSEIIPKALELLPEDLQKKLIVTQQCRHEQLQDVKTFYEKLGIEACLESFFSDIPGKLRNADLAICRAGASTVAELTCLGVPAVFVPLAISKDNDQGENARLVVNAGGGWILNELEFTPPVLAQLLESIMNNKKSLSAMSESIHHLGKPNAAKDLADWVESFSQDSYL
ncbi:MAG: undecaprenyldiphospho-muramoylpentapeptide beta-N-acetylglucosaminyltransferase [Pseudomonadota bacterium]|jgi:UDP-N-acetylglucosamine--N-acetylmuramyl-(pentapeptide) pyrophosphoryl-undecaprenol N-acetylglucosamine transferase|nr:undecaprenyldiphospho-muramoylpentapeptide beta-N-acetylglucosaminyltransferase [Alphaproteobacteria bacterium]